MRKGWFQRTDPTPYKVRLDLTGPVTIVNQNEYIYADVFTFKDVIGFKFVGWTKPEQPKSEDPSNPVKIEGYESIKLVGVSGAKQAPHKEFLKSLKERKDLKEETKPTEIVCAEDTEEVPLQAPPAAEKTPENKEKDKQALIEYLSKFDNKKWFVMKKEDARDYIDRLELDRSNLPNVKNEFIKLLKDYIKSLGK